MFSRRSMPCLSPTSAAGTSPSRPACARYPNFDFIRLVAASSVIFSHAFQISEGTDDNEPLVHLLGALRSAAPILARGVLQTHSDPVCPPAVRADRVTGWWLQTALREWQRDRLPNCLRREPGRPVSRIAAIFLGHPNRQQASASTLYQGIERANQQHAPTNVSRLEASALISLA
jgi:hypothetical protein